MPPDRKKLKDLADSLKNTAKDLQANAKSLFDALDSNKDWGEIEKALSSVAGEHADLLESLVQMGDELGAGIRTEPTSTFANFLGEVGRAAVDTQKRLEHQKLNALLGLCEALDLPRRLYDETLSGSHGFWILVVPGVIHNRQPRFNEGPPMWHLEGATLPLLNPLPV